MCGIAGYSCLNQYDSRINIAFPILALYMENRGRKSWGWTDGKEQIVKTLGTISDGMNPSFLGYKEAALHTRQPTTGATVADNSHPFRIGDVLGMHNGVVRNHDELQKKYDRKCAVDSEHIFYHIAENRDLGDISAYGAIVFWRNGKLHLGRFNGGELTLVKTENAWMFASTKDSLEVALRLSGLSKGAVYFKLKEGQLYRIEGDKLYKDMELNFSEYDTRKYGTWQNQGGYGYGSYYDDNEDFNWAVEGEWKDVDGKRTWIVKKDGTVTPTQQSFVTNSTPRHSQIHGLSANSRQGRVLEMPASGTDTQPKDDDTQYRYMSSDARIKKMIDDSVNSAAQHEGHKGDKWPCGFCGVNLYDGDFYYMLDNAEIVCEACAEEHKEDITSQRLNVLPQDVMMVSAFFSKPGDIQKMTCEICNDVLEGSDFFVLTQDNLFMCIQCFAAGDGEEDGDDIEFDTEALEAEGRANEDYQRRAAERLEELEDLTVDNEPQQSPIGAHWDTVPVSQVPDTGVPVHLMEIAGFKAPESPAEVAALVATDNGVVETD